MSAPTPQSDRWLWTLLLVLLGAIGVAALSKLGPLLSPQAAQTAPLDPDCDLRAGPCTARFPGGGEVRFSVEPVGIPVSTPLTLGVGLKGMQASAVAVDFAGVDMNMGFNRPTLSPVPGQEGAGFQGSGMLPVCVRQRMTWEARVLLRTPQGLLAAPFRFETSR